MTDGKETVTGEVGKINLWKKKPGYFLLFMGKEQEFYGFGKCPVEVGQTVTYEVSQGTGSFEDKVKLDKLVKGKTELPSATQKVPTGKSNMEELMDKGDRVYFDKQDLIVRQTCIKAGAVVVGALVHQQSGLSRLTVANEVIEMADRLYGWVTMRDEHLPEPPEEP